jgi:hypothetical protein
LRNGGGQQSSLPASLEETYREPSPKGGAAQKVS